MSSRRWMGIGVSLAALVLGSVVGVSPAAAAEPSAAALPPKCTLTPGPPILIGKEVEGRAVIECVATVRKIEFDIGIYKQSVLAKREMPVYENTASALATVRTSCTPILTVSYQVGVAARVTGLDGSVGLLGPTFGPAQTIFCLP